VTGLHALFKNQSSASHFHALVLMVVAFVLFMIVPYLLMGKIRKALGFDDVLLMGITPVVFMLLVAVAAWLTKSLSGVKSASLKTELLTGALTFFPMLLFLVVLGLARHGPGPGSDLREFVIAVWGTVLLLVFVIEINILKQSLRASGSVSDNAGWYAAFLGVCAANGITMLIFHAIN
jgi:hypothetical protein